MNIPLAMPLCTVMKETGLEQKNYMHSDGYKYSEVVAASLLKILVAGYFGCRAQ